MKRPLRVFLNAGAASAAILLANVAAAAPAAPSGPHPRIWLNAATLDAMKAKMADPKSAAGRVIANCKDVAARPTKYDNSVYQGYGWAHAAASCGASWQLTKDPAHAAAGLRMFKALLEDYNDVGDAMGGNTAEEHDGGYSMRYFGAFTAIAYDWFHDAPGFDALFPRARELFKVWVTWYEKDGYLKDAPGSNYHAGYLYAKTMIAIAAAGEDDGSAALYWTDVVDNKFPKELLAKGLGTDGPLVGGDWPEGWEYGPLGVLEYAMAARALEEQGVKFPELHTWASDLSVNFLYALTPDKKGFFVGGDWGQPSINAPPSQQPLLAAMAGPGSDQAAGWAAQLHATSVTSKDECPVYEALAEARSAVPVDFTATPQPLFYVTKGTRKVYARSGWDANAMWAVLVSSPKFGVDHQHLDASNFVFSRGSDALIADPSPYGSLSTLTSNAITVDSKSVQNNYRPSQSPKSTAGLPWARATASGIVAARSDFAGAFDGDMKSDVPLARRDWVFLSEGEVIAIDRVKTDSATRSTYLRFRSPAPLAFEGAAGPQIAVGMLGASKVVIHPVTVSGGAAELKPIKAQMGGPCDSGPFGVCTAARFAVTEYALKIPGPFALAVHVIDGLAAADAPSEVAAVTDPAIVGAAVTRSGKRTFVLASSAKNGAIPASLAYAVPGETAARHVVFDAPEDASGKASVAAVAVNGTCSITLTPGGAMAFEGRPLIFAVSSATDGCKLTEDASVAPPTGAGPGGEIPGTNPVDPNAPPPVVPGAAPGAGGESGGCGCGIFRDTGTRAGLLSVVGGTFALAMMRRRRRSEP